MSGDRLAQIEERKSFYDEDGEWVYLSAEERDALVEIARAMERIAKQQPMTLDWLQANEIVFDGPLGTDRENWQHVAFSIYNDLCEVDTTARNALGALDAD